jgi:hypothetical protein
VVGIDGHSKPVGDVHALFGQFPSHLPQRSILSSDKGKIVQSDFIKPKDVRFFPHISLPGSLYYYFIVIYS